MTALGQRYKLIHGTLRRLRRKLPDADTDALRTLAETDAASAVLLAAIADGKTSKDMLAAYTRLVDQRVALLTRLRLLPPLPRARVSDDDPENDPEVRAFAERVQQEERERLRRAGVID